MSAVSTDLRPVPRWRGAIVSIAALWAVLLIVHWRTALSMVSIWRSSDTFAHCWLVLPISLWLVWRKRQDLAAAQPQPQPWLLVPLAGAALLWLVGDLATVNAATHFALVAMLVLAVPAVLGMATASTILFPLLFLFFAVPFGEFLLQPMMDWTADFVVFGLRLAGVPVFREGLLFVIPTGTWSVIDECSGVRYMIASFMVGTLFAYLNYRSYKRRAIFMLVALLVPIGANWLRAFIIVMMGHLSNNKLAVGVDHLLYGWIFFGIVIFIMFAIGARWSEPDGPSVAAGPKSLRGAFVPIASSTSALAVGIGAILVAAAPAAYVWSLQRAEAAAALPVLELPAGSAGWTASDDSNGQWTPKYTHPSTTAHRVYRGPAGTVGVYIAYYRDQSGHRKLVSSQNGLIGINDRKWLLSTLGSTSVPKGDFRVSEIRAVDTSAPGRRAQILAWSSYWVDGRFITGDMAARLAVTLQRLQGRGDDGAGVVIYADEPSVEASRAAIEAFVATNLDPIGQLLARTRQTR